MGRRRVVPHDGSPTPRRTRNSVVLRPPRLPSPPAPRGGRGPGRGAQRPFANQKNRRAQNDLGRRPSTPQKRGAVDQGHSAATERTQALDDEPRRPARHSAARRSFKGQLHVERDLVIKVTVCVRIYAIDATHRLARRSSPRSAPRSPPARPARRSSTSASRRTCAARVRSSDSRPINQRVLTPSRDVLHAARDGGRDGGRALIRRNRRESRCGRWR